jgi:hypothetical protein
LRYEAPLIRPIARSPERAQDISCFFLDRDLHGRRQSGHNAIFGFTFALAVILPELQNMEVLQSVRLAERVGYITSTEGVFTMQGTCQDVQWLAWEGE